MNPFKKKSIITLIAVFFILFKAGGQTLPHTSLYVSTTGAGGSFTQQSPGNIADLAGKLREINTTPRNVIVYMQGGRYNLQQPISLTSIDVGRIKSVKLQGATNQNTLITGSIRVTGWVPYKDGIYKAQVPKGLDTRQLYINGKIAIRARTPNRTNDVDYGPYRRVVEFDATNNTIVLNSPELLSVKDISNVEVVINQHWYQTRVRIASISQQGNNCVIVPAGNVRAQLFGMRAAHDLLFPGRPYYLENSLDFLDTACEWYLDKDRQTIYYKPAPGENINTLDAEIPVLTSLMKITGTPSHPITNIQLNNLHFSYSTWLFPTYAKGVIESQAVIFDFLSRSIMIPGIIEANFANHLSIKGCEISNAGGNGIVFEKGVKNSTIYDTHIHHTCANSITIDPFTFKVGNLPDSTKCTYDTVKNNLIEDMGLNYTNAMGLLASCVSNLLVENNEIRYGRYAGMQVGNLFGNVSSGVENNTIRFNNVHHVLSLHDDSGAIYILGNQPGTVVSDNWIHDITKGPWEDNKTIAAIYMDNSSAYMTIEHNLIENTHNVLDLEMATGGKTAAHDNKVDKFKNGDVSIRNKAGLQKIAN
jgi:hypothetical protein